MRLIDTRRIAKSLCEASNHPLPNKGAPSWMHQEHAPHVEYQVAYYPGRCSLCCS